MKRQCVREVFDAAYYAALEDGLSPDQAAHHADTLMLQEQEQRQEMHDQQMEGER